MEQSVTEEHWATLERYRQAVELAFQKEVLPYPDFLAEYDQVISAGKDALEARGIDLDQPTQAYVVASTIAWMSNIVVGLISGQCSDPHVFSHLREALMWPAYIVRETTLDIALPEEDASESH